MMAAYTNSAIMESGSGSRKSRGMRVSGRVPNRAKIIRRPKRSGLGPAKVGKLGPEEVDSDAETTPSGGEEADSDADTITIESTDDEELASNTLQAPMVPGEQVCVGHCTTKYDGLNPEQKKNFWGRRSGKIVPRGWTASRREARLAKMSRPLVPRGSAKRKGEPIRTFNRKKGSSKNNSSLKREDEVRRSRDLGRKRKISPADSVNTTSPVPKNKNGKEAALIGRLEDLIMTFDLNKWVSEEKWNVDEPGKRVKGWAQGSSYM